MPDGPVTSANEAMVTQNDLGIAEAIIKFGSVTDTTEDAKYLPNTSGIYNDYYVVNRYETDRHVYMLSVTSPDGFNGDEVAFCQMGTGTLLWICDWTAERLGAEPDKPTPEPADNSIVLLDDHYEPAMMELMADGVTEVWRISGTFVYGFKNPTVPFLVHPRPPWLDDVINRHVTASTFVPNIKDQTGQAGGESAPDSSGSENKPTNPAQAGLAQAQD